MKLPKPSYFQKLIVVSIIVFASFKFIDNKDIVFVISFIMYGWLNWELLNER